MKIISYLIFNGEAEAAAHFYAKAFDGKIDELHHYSDCPPDSCSAGKLSEEHLNRVMHAYVSANGWTMGLADTVAEDVHFGNGLMTTLMCESAEEAERRWKNLSEEALKVATPLQKTFFAKLYGELTDRFGVQWAVLFE